jgi:tetratricopeptide (TPR) repeat protein
MHDSFSTGDATLADTALSVAASRAIEAGDPFGALAVYENAVRQGAVDPITLGNYGVLLWRLFQFRKGAETFTRVVENPHANTATLRRVAHCYFEIGRFSKAADVMRVAVSRLAQPDAATTNTLAWTLERDHQTDESRKYAEAAHALDPTYGPAVRLLAHLDMRAGDLDGASARLTEQLRHYSSDSDWGLRYELAAVCDRLGQYDAAWTVLCQAKSQLAPQTANHLRDSHFIRRRQWELTQSVTPADLRRWRQDGDSLMSPKRIAFLFGFPRSGTTLMEQIIASQGDTIDTDESGIFNGQFLAPLVWKAEDALSAIIELRSFDIEQLVAGRETFYQLTESYLDQPIGERLLIEKNPLQTADLPLTLRLFPEGRLLVALRDPRDVVLSYLFTMIPLNWSSAPATNVVEACHFYADTMRHWLWWRKRFDWPRCETRYEDLIADPRGETQRIAAFLDLTWNAAMLDERERSERKAVRTPTYVDVTQPLYSRSIGRWRNYEEYLAPSFDMLTPFLGEFGYT